VNPLVLDLFMVAMEIVVPPEAVAVAHAVEMAVVEEMVAVRRLDCIPPTLHAPQRGT
jgi:hypothetical protein